MTGNLAHKTENKFYLTKPILSQILLIHYLNPDCFFFFFYVSYVFCSIKNGYHFADLIHPSYHIVGTPDRFMTYNLIIGLLSIRTQFSLSESS